MRAVRIVGTAACLAVLLLSTAAVAVHRKRDFKVPSGRAGGDGMPDMFTGDMGGGPGGGMHPAMQDKFAFDQNEVGGDMPDMFAGTGDHPGMNFGDLPKFEGNDFGNFDGGSRDHTAGAEGWIKTGKFNNGKKARPDDAPPLMNDGFDEWFKKQQEGGGMPGMDDGQMPSMDDLNPDDIAMDPRFTGMSSKPSRDRKKGRKGAVDTPQERQGAKGDGPMKDGSFQTDTCLRQAIRFCPIRVMNENFAMFTECVVQFREQFKGECIGWAELQSECMYDMVQHCQKKDPPATTQCLVANEKKLSDLCRKSPMYEAMTEGFEQMQDRMKKSGMSDAAEAESNANNEEDGAEEQTQPESGATSATGEADSASDEL